MVPVIQEEHAEILIIIGGGGSVDNNATEDSLPGLQGKVGMIPCATIL